MSTLNNVELIIITVVLSLFFILGCILIFYLLNFLRSINKLSKKAESFIDNAQSAAETIQRLGNASKQNFPLIRLINHIFDNGSRHRDK